MKSEYVHSSIVNILEDTGLDLTEKQIKSYRNKILELSKDEDLTDEEIEEELYSLCPKGCNEDDEWIEFIDELKNFLTDLENDVYDESDSLYGNEDDED